MRGYSTPAVPGRTFTPAGAAPAITTSSPLPGGTQASAYSQTLAATGGTLPLVWSVLSGALPSGITLSAAGVLSGTPLADGATYTFVVQVRDNVGRTGTKTFALTIATLAAPSITTASPLPNGTLGVAYSQALAASGGYGAMAWDVSAGAVPAGTSLSAGGTLSGTPTTAAAYNFTARVTDALGHVGTKAFDVTIAPAYVYGNWAWLNNNNLPFATSGGFWEPSMFGYHAGRDKIIMLQTGTVKTFQYDPTIVGDGAWSNLAMAPPGFTVATQTTRNAWYDAVGGRLIFCISSNYAGYYNQLWAWDGTWSRLDTGNYPRDTSGAASGYSTGFSVNPTGGTGGTPLLVLLNGWDNRTFRYDFGANSWSSSLSGLWGTGPNGDVRMCYSPALGKHIFYWSGASRTFAYNDAAGTWEEITTAHAPAAFTGNGTMLYNAAQAHIALHPWSSSGSTRDLWTFDGVDWTDTGKICVRPGYAGFCYDATRRRLLAGVWTSVWYIDNV